MSSEVDICNLALSHLGDDGAVTAINPPDGTVQAAKCAVFYPIARGVVLERHPFRFNTRRAVLAVSPTTPPTGWDYAYTLPSDCVRPLAVISPTALPDFEQDGGVVSGIVTDTTNAQDFVCESVAGGEQVIYTNVETATLLYAVLVTDTTKYTVECVAAIARLLASYLAGVLIKGKAGIAVSDAQRKLFEAEFGMAATRDANARQTNPYTTSAGAAAASRQ